MTSAQAPESYYDKDVVDPQGDKIGSVKQVYLNDDTGQADWVTVHTGLFGLRESFVPLAGSRIEGDNLVVPFDKGVVKDAPDINDASHLDEDESDRLYNYYQGYIGGGSQAGSQTTGTQTYAGTDYSSGGTAGTDDLSGTTGADYGTTTSTTTTTDYATGTQGRDTSGPNTDDAMTRSEERLKVGTQQVEAGRARLRKYVVTEQQTVNVPVSREEVRIEREPITDANRDAAYSGADISEEEHEVVLHAEQPVVQTEAVPVERVRLGTETVTEQQAVSGEVRKEQIEVEDGTSSSGTRTGTSGYTDTDETGSGRIVSGSDTSRTVGSEGTTGTVPADDTSRTPGSDDYSR